MKKLGLIGGTGPESTIIYYRKITSGVQKRLNRDVFPHLSIESLSVFEVLAFCEEQNYKGLTDYLLEGLQHLAAAGADCAALTGITPHIVYRQLCERAPLPVISMVDTACQYAVAKGFHRLALLGTIPTMNGTFFQEPFAAQNITVITPDDTEKKFIANKISAELEFGIVTAETTKGMRKIAERMIAEENVDAIVLGCTELPLIFEKMDLPVEKMDVMDIHIHALIEKILGE